MGRGTSKAGGGAGGAEQTAEYKYERLIGNGRTGRSELDNAETVEREEVSLIMQKRLNKSGR